MEVVGKVQHDLTVKVFQAMDFGPNIGMFRLLLSPIVIQDVLFSFLRYVAADTILSFFSLLKYLQTNYSPRTDYAAVEALVDATHRYKEIFYESAD